MQRKSEYLLQEISGNWVVVATGEESSRFNGMIRMNETGAFLFQQLESEKTEDELVKALLNRYELSEEEACAGVKEFLEFMGQTELLQ